MSKFISLTRVLLKAGGSPFQLNAKSKIKGAFLTIFLLLCFAPIICMTTYSFMASYDALAAQKLQGVILSSMIAVSCVAMIVFGILYVVSIYYYAEDTEKLITLPLKPSQILASKFVQVVIYEYFIEFVTVLPVLIGYGIKIRTVMFCVYSVIIFITLPIIPVVICSIITMIVMSFTGIVKNKDLFKVVSGVLIIAIAMSFSFISQSFGKSNQDPGVGMAKLLINNKDKINAATNIFPSARIPAWSLIEADNLKGILYLIIFLAVSMLLFYLFTILGHKLYFKGAVGINESEGSQRRLSEKEFTKLSLRQSKLKSYIIKELRLLVRTPAYFLNCVLAGVVFPPLITVLMFAPERAQALKYMKLGSIIFVIACGMVGLFNSISSVTSTSISREGKNLFICRYMPVEASTQVLAKILSGIIINTIGIVLTIIAGGILLKITLPYMIMIFIVSIFSIILLSLTGIMIDIIMPKLTWDNETVAVKNNLNVMLNMIISLVVFGAVTGVAALLTYYFKMETSGIFILLMLVYFILDLIMYLIVQGPIVKTFSKIEQ